MNKYDYHAWLLMVKEGMSLGIIGVRAGSWSLPPVSLGRPIRDWYSQAPHLANLHPSIIHTGG